MMEYVEFNQLSGLTDYLMSVDWTDPWLSILLAFHGFTFITTFLTRNYGNIQAVLFLTLLFLVYVSERLNELGAKYWRSFSRQQYFDSHGMFISLVFSLPLLFNCLAMVCYWLWTSGTLLVQLKRAQILTKQNIVAKEEKDK
ncbi:hypothetical protein CHUAL_000812 [Chamberlinius hualienensis]